jgi:RimJ/RimL family protein N-acetyltransferase
MPEIPLPDPPLTDGVVALRPFTEEDVRDVSACCQDPEIPRWTRVPSPYDEDDARTFIATAEDGRLAGERLSLAVTNPETGDLLGAIEVRAASSEGGVGIGYWVAGHARRRGTAVRALRLVSAWAFRALGAQRVQVVAHPLNEASQRVALRAGFTREGLLRNYELRKGEWEDRVMFSLVPTDPSRDEVPTEPTLSLGIPRELGEGHGQGTGEGRQGA